MQNQFQDSNSKRIYLKLYKIKQKFTCCNWSKRNNHTSDIAVFSGKLDLLNQAQLETENVLLIIVSLQNEDLIVWMRTAALPTFRKLYRKVKHDEVGFGEGLVKGLYTLKVEYSKYSLRMYMSRSTSNPDKSNSIFDLI